jgi:hypothetical protein
MDSKTEQLNFLFQKWEEQVPEYIGHFVKDGIIDEELFRNTNPKILFITKEPNNPKKDAHDFRVWWNTELKYAFSLRTSEWTYGILNRFPPYDIIKRSDKDRFEAIHKIAFMNVKKIGGGSLSEYENIINSVKQDFIFIHKEIEIIDPDIIILGLSWKEVRTEVFPDLKDKWQESGYDIAIARFNKAKVIDFYHPSSRNAPAASYSLLQNVINSSAFINL